MSTHALQAPADPVAAVTHPDPYPFYAGLRDGPALVWEPRLRLWVASRADVIQRLLVSPALAVRPRAEPVPAAIAGGPAGEMFAQLIRMNDGPAHSAWRPVLQRGLASLDTREARAAARALAAGSPVGALDDAVFQLPVQAVAHALGFARAQLPQVVGWMREFVACLSPLSTADELQAAHRAAESLMARMAAIADASPPRDASLLQAVLAHAPAASRSARPLLANLVGLMSQTCDATAGLLGLSLLARTREGGTLPRSDALHGWMEEVARHDAPVQNTRRFVIDDVALEGESLGTGQAVLLVLAAGNRDPALNPAPEVFDGTRIRRRLLGFGHGPHACPGQALAIALASGALEVLHAQGRHREALATHAGRFRPSVNARIPSWA